LDLNLYEFLLVNFPEPEEPEVPRIVKRDKGQIMIQLSTMVNGNGPITAYHIVVVYGVGQGEFRKDMLKSFYEAQSEGIPYYIAAELNPQVRLLTLISASYEVRA
jgi:hypothetical protein